MPIENRTGCSTYAAGFLTSKKSLREVHIAISRLDREIELLHEYRTRLIADVVTGKLDVREAAARFSDEPNEAEALDVAADMLADADDETAGVDLDAAAEEVEA